MGIQPRPDPVSCPPNSMGPGHQFPHVLFCISHTIRSLTCSIIFFNTPSSPGFVSSLVPDTKAQNWQDTDTALTI